MKFAFLLAGLLCCLATASGAQADERRVIVLMPRGLPNEAWSGGTQAVIAELAAGDYQVIVEASLAASLEGLLQELSATANTPSAVGAVAVLRRGKRGIAYVWTQHDARIFSLEGPVTQGAVGEGALALRVSELVRTRDWHLQEASAAPEKTPPPEPVRHQPLEPRTPTRGPLLWLGAGPLFSSGTSAPFACVAFGSQLPLQGPLTLDATVSMSLVPLKIPTRAGSLSLSTRQLSAHLLLDVWRTSASAVAFGPGGGLTWVQESAEAAPGFIGSSDTGTVALLSARAQALLATKHVSFVLVAEPGLLLPGISVRADDSELVRLGKPWLAVSAGVGWNL